MKILTLYGGAYNAPEIDIEITNEDADDLDRGIITLDDFFTRLLPEYDETGCLIKRLNIHFHHDGFLGGGVYDPDIRFEIRDDGDPIRPSVLDLENLDDFDIDI